MKKKNEKSTYEYFKVDEMFFVGKHRDYVEQLWTKGKIQESHFERLVDLYAIAAIIGLRTGKKSPEINDGTGLKRTVQMKQIIGCHQVLLTIMRLILIFDENRNLSLEERVESAFVIPEDEEMYRVNMELFNSYARGGVEYLYDNLILRTPDVDEDIADRRNANILALLKRELDVEEIL